MAPFGSVDGIKVRDIIVNSKRLKANEGADGKVDPYQTLKSRNVALSMTVDETHTPHPTFTPCNLEEVLSSGTGVAPMSTGGSRPSFTGYSKRRNNRIRPLARKIDSTMNIQASGAKVGNAPPADMTFDQ